jgi:hypothetical protein
MRNTRPVFLLTIAAFAAVLLVATACSSGDRASDVGSGPTTQDNDEGSNGGDPVVDDPEVEEIEWDRAASSYSDADGPVSVTCKAGDSQGPVWGTGPFTADSSICTAAVFAGQIAPHYGGEATFEISEGLESYEGGEANGVTTQPHGPSDSSFDFVG